MVAFFLSYNFPSYYLCYQRLVTSSRWEYRTVPLSQKTVTDMTCDQSSIRNSQPWPNWFWGGFLNTRSDLDHTPTAIQQALCSWMAELHCPAPKITWSKHNFFLQAVSWWIPKPCVGESIPVVFMLNEEALCGKAILSSCLMAWREENLSVSTLSGEASPEGWRWWLSGASSVFSQHFPLWAASPGCFLTDRAPPPQLAGFPQPEPDKIVE